MIIIGKKLSANSQIKLHTEMSPELYLDGRNKRFLLSISLLKINTMSFYVSKEGNILYTTT